MAELGLLPRISLGRNQDVTWLHPHWETQQEKYLLTTFFKLLAEFSFLQLQD